MGGAIVVVRDVPLFNLALFIGPAQVFVSCVDTELFYAIISSLFLYFLAFFWWRKLSIIMPDVSHLDTLVWKV